MAKPDLREYAVEARSTDTFGRVLASCRNHHFVVDGPVQNGCPGEAVTPAELFLAGVATCGVELLGVLAKQQGAPLTGVQVQVRGRMDRANPVRPDLSLFNQVRLTFRLDGVTGEQAAGLIESFKRR
jgi:uncharacterized OsmC-like protein